MKCLILAAGYATRLYPLTENFPKPLLEVQGKAILNWLIEDIDSTGQVSEYIVISNHKFARHFTQWAAKQPQKITVLDDGTTCDENRLGAVRDIQFAIEQRHLQEELLVIAGDNLLDFSLATFLEYARQKQTTCVMRYDEPSLQRLQKCGVAVVDANDRIVKMVEKSPNPPSHWCCPAFYIYAAADVPLVAQGLAEGCMADAPGGFIAWLSQQTPVFAMEMPGKRYDIGTLESYENAKKLFKSHQSF